MFPNMKRHLSDDSTIIHNPVFERAIVKLQGGCEKDLTATGKRQIRRFETSEDDDEEAVAAEEAVSQGTERRCCWMSTVECEPACCNRTSIA
jgi:hypothetical protein